MAVFNRIQVGQILYDRHRYKTNVVGLNPMGEWRVKVISIDTERKGAMCSWNGNPPRWYSERDLARLHIKSKRESLR